LLIQKIAGLLAGFVYKIYSATFRYQLIFEKSDDRNLFFDDLNHNEARPGKNLIYACFHQDDLSCLPYFAQKNICILISNSKDGQILASAAEYMGYQTVRGSSHRGGVAGLLAAMRKVIECHKMTIAVDGPRGPIYQVKECITALSIKSQRPIVPIRGYPIRKFVFKKSWNNATLPMPFTKINLKVGRIDFYSTKDLEKKMREL
jgi:lysophospholipid acyltransferase (LPLAT)-like uncharacterized protein